MVKVSSEAPRGWKKSIRFFLPLILLFCLLATAGFRPGKDMIGEGQNQEASEKLELNYIAKDAEFVLSVRPKGMLKKPKLFPLLEIAPTVAEIFVSDGVFPKVTGAKFQDFDQVSIVVRKTIGKMNGTRPIMILRSKTDIRKSIQTIAKTDGKVGRKDLYILKNSKSFKDPTLRNLFRFGYLADDRTVIWSETKESLGDYVSVRKSDVKSTKWFSSAKNQLDSDGLLILPNQLFDALRKLRDESPNSLTINEFPGILEANFLLTSFKVKKEVEASTFIEFTDSKKAKVFTKSLEAGIEFAKKMLAIQNDSKDKKNAGIASLGLDVLDSIEIKKSRRSVSVMSRIPLRPIPFSHYVDRSRESSVRTASMNNMKVIGLTMFRNGQKKKFFPGPVFRSKNGKKHSWRIAMLKDTDSHATYESYRFDEEWDSPHNQKVTAKVDPSYGFPNDKSKTAASYYLVSGPGTLFPNEQSLENGIPWAQVTDGLSNTVLAVEVKLDKHWADPSLVSFDDLFKDGKFRSFQKDGKINVLMADGSVKTLEGDVDREYFKAMLTPNGGEKLDRFLNK